MANRNQDYQSGRRSGGYRSWEDDDDRRYGDYANTDEGDSSVRAGRYDEGRGQFGRRDTNEQSGSTGRYAGYGDFGQGDYSQGRGRNTGQDRYGMSGFGGRGEQGYGYGRSGQGSYGQGGQSDYGYGRSGSSQFGGSQGMHRGKGPKGYQRSDERLKEMICERLLDDPDIDASEVTVACQGGRITLEGTVDSRQTKNAIEDVAEQFGVEHVQNNLRVQRQGQGGQGQGTETSNKGSARTSAGSDESEQTKQRKN